MKILRLTVAFPLLVVALPLLTVSILIVGLASAVAGEDFVSDLLEARKDSQE